MRDLLDIYQNTETVARLAELDELVQPTLVEMAGTLGYDCAFIALVDEHAGRMQGAVGINPPDLYLDMAVSDGSEPGPIVQSLRTGRPVRVDDALRDARVSEGVRPFHAASGLIAFAAVP